MFNTIQGKNLSFPQNALYSANFQRFTPLSRKKVDGLWAFCVPAKARRKKKMPYSLIFSTPSGGCSQRCCGRCRNLVMCYNRTCYEHFSVSHSVCSGWSSGACTVATPSIGAAGRGVDAYAFHARAYIYKETLRVPAGRLAAGPRRATQKGCSMPISNVGDALPELASDVAVLSKRAYNVVGYSLPRVHKGEKWYVDFYQMDRGRGCMRRKKYYINMAMAVRERTKYARELIARLSTLLRCGWNVWSGAGKGLRTATSIYVLAELYRNHLKKSEGAGTLRPSSVGRYTSYLNNFLRWSCSIRREPLAAAYEITREVIVDYLDYILLDCENTANYRNNNLVWLSSFCEFLAERGYIGANPCHGIAKLREGEKFREPFTAHQLTQLRDYLLREDPYYYLACLLTYYGLIRPLELTYIKIGDISLQDKAIVLHGEHTKNGRDAAIAINNIIARHMVSLGVLSAPSHYYLFGPHFRPGEKRIAVQSIRGRFNLIRRALRWPMELQYYSLKDAGIRDLANSEGVVIARDQARHTDISTTNKYIKRHDMQVHDEVKAFKGAL